jgi:hypothetical protein
MGFVVPARVPVAAHPSPAAYRRPCVDHLALSLRRLRAALAALEAGDVPAALHIASALQEPLHI